MYFSSTVCTSHKIQKCNRITAQLQSLQKKIIKQYQNKNAIKQIVNPQISRNSRKPHRKRTKELRTLE